MTSKSDKSDHSSSQEATPIDDGVLRELSDLALMARLDQEGDDDVDLDIGERELAKLADLRFVGDVLREVVDGDDRCDVADAIMARIDADDLPAEDPLFAELADEDEDDDDVEQTAESADDSEGELRLRKEPLKGLDDKPSNDNARNIFAAAGLAAAVAAGLFIWGTSQPSDDALAVRPASAPIERAASPETSAPTPAPETLQDGTEDDEDSPPVEIAAVDFGNGTGSVFYVGGTASQAPTTVVWINDLGDE